MSTSGLQENVEQVAARTAPTRRRVPRVVRLARMWVSKTGSLVTENLGRQDPPSHKTGHLTDNIAPHGPTRGGCGAISRGGWVVRGR
jgi:hypothetical protein